MVFFQSLKYILILCLIGNLSLADNANIADKIQHKFDENLYKMRSINQSHYAIRLYRITGKKDYLYPIISFQFIESVQLENLTNRRKASLKKFDAKQLKLPPNYEDLSKTKRRKLLLAQVPGINNALNMLLILDHAQQLNVLNSPLYPHAKIALNYIKKNKSALGSFLLDLTVIKTSSAQVANFIYLLNRLNIIDLRREFLQRFKMVFPDENDASLSDKVFEDKIYGMTHIIFAASGYYQTQLSYEEFQWIYLYFEQNIDRILLRTKPDVIAEVGLTFCLLNNNKHSATINKVKAALENQFNPLSQMITNKAGSDDLNLAEHRNVLTIMLFKWPLKLHSGPNLEDTASLMSTLKPIQPL